MQNKGTGKSTECVSYYLQHTLKKVNLLKQQSDSYSAKDLFMNVHNRCKARWQESLS